MAIIVTSRTQPTDTPTARQVRADFDDETIVVYQAYSSHIAFPAVSAQRFVPPFKMDRMTWIKPSFLWMMYRSGWGTKVGQERVLAIRIGREGFEWALLHSSLSHFEPTVYTNHEQWIQRRDSSPVRIQWDPERSLTLQAEQRRAIQVGLSGEATERYVSSWTHEISDVTDLAHEIRDLVSVGDLRGARALLPTEGIYPLPDAVRSQVGAD